MFEKDLIVKGSLRNTDAGVAVDLRIPYYRGLGLSMVERVGLAIDGQPVDPESITFAVHGNEYTLAELETAVDDRWGFHEPATVSIHNAGPLTAGDHDVSASVLLRISYLPFQHPMAATSTQTI